jgi:hypothetical protein
MLKHLPSTDLLLLLCAAAPMLLCLQNLCKRKDIHPQNLVEQLAEYKLVAQEQI